MWPICLLVIYLFLCISGCRTEWDAFWCWYRAEVGHVVNVSCYEVSQFFAINHGKLLLSHAAFLIFSFFYCVCYQIAMKTNLIFKTEFIGWIKWHGLDELVDSHSGGPGAFCLCKPHSQYYEYPKKLSSCHFKPLPKITHIHLLQHIPCQIIPFGWSLVHSGTAIGDTNCLTLFSDAPTQGNKSDKANTQRETSRVLCKFIARALNIRIS